MDNCCLNAGAMAARGVEMWSVHVLFLEMAHSIVLLPWTTVATGLHLCTGWSPSACFCWQPRWLVRLVEFGLFSSCLFEQSFAQDTPCFTCRVLV